LKGARRQGEVGGDETGRAVDVGAARSGTAGPRSVLFGMRTYVIRGGGRVRVLG